MHTVPCRCSTQIRARATNPEVTADIPSTLTFPPCLCPATYAGSNHDPLYGHGLALIAQFDAIAFNADRTHVELLVSAATAEQKIHHAANHAQRIENDSGHRRGNTGSIDDQTGIAERVQLARPDGLYDHRQSARQLPRQAESLPLLDNVACHCIQKTVHVYDVFRRWIVGFSLQVASNRALPDSVDKCGF